MEAEKVVQRDWSSLLPELLNFIAKNLSEISDFVRFRAVCTAWRFSTLITDFPPKFPWILDRRQYPYEPHMYFYSTTSSKVYTIHASKCSGKRFIGTSQGYMLIVDKATTTKRNTSGQYTYQFYLLNPLNNHEFPLPLCALYANFRTIGPQHYQIGENVVLLDYDFKSYKFIFCCLGQDNWSELKSGYDMNFGFFRLKSMLFRVKYNTGVIEITDLTTGTLIYVIPPVENFVVGENYYLIDASGDILMVLKHRDSSQELYNDLFDVYRLELSRNSSPCWVKVNNIGNQALFIDNYGGFALEANDFAGVKANYIYYIELHSWVKRIDIKTGNWELQCPLKNPECWFVPKLQHLQAQ
ncbi:F-box protein skip23 [Rhynchospora pubera]|uniref:F-box protein skip23 n=1 Tax=Rhynchospora pubera TaxID=906938 RepID=A0AAV8GGT1_9POAL|nr:F-box protein skip23 [Rhynchospora pubera]